MKNLKLFEEYTITLQRMNYSENTIKVYLSYFKQFIYAFSNKNVRHISYDEIVNYLNSFVDQDSLSPTKQNQIINCIKFYYEKILGQPRKFYKLRRPRGEKKLPKVIDQEELLGKIVIIPNLKHKTILTLTYSVGLRVSEIVNLKIADIDSQRMLIYINNAKGRKDRIVPLSESVLKLLRFYYTQYKPKEYLFNGQNSLKYSISSCQAIYKQYIDTKTSIHNLRHSSFTALLENGTNMRLIQRIAGHKNISTTEIYTHVSNKLLSQVRLPI